MTTALVTRADIAAGPVRADPERARLRAPVLAGPDQENPQGAPTAPLHAGAQAHAAGPPSCKSFKYLGNGATWR